MSDSLKKLKAVNVEIQRLEIEVVDPSTNPHCGARANEAVASLIVPNKLFLLWDSKIELQKRIGATISKLSDMLNCRIKAGYNAVVIKSSGESFEKRLIANSQR